MLRRLSYANVAATLALVLSMSGGALAAKQYLINSTSEINPKVLKKLRGRSGRAGAVGVPGKEGTPGKEGPQGKEGVPGKEGPQGKEGKGGATNVVMRQGPATVVADGDFNVATANCNAGERATGGGLFNEDNVYFPRIVASEPTPNSSQNPPTGDGKVPTGWRVWVAMNDEGAEKAPASITVYAYVICAAP